MSFVERAVVKMASYLVSPRIAYRLGRAILATQGIGWAGPANGVRGSGEASFLRHYLATREAPIVFDVGANIGDYASAVMSANPSAAMSMW